ncbi:pyridoxal-dependent decarboxylase [Cyanobium sp. Lug-B]|uniref:pyridoxal-dependent decarboxylase n=1 Tax=Cyanobium sp. Lug-B TaxID=2823716 RepID=UPI0020CC210F|nr:pyridoxal-dependent decarboxylase [Cyanobium sp. Lug-B]MCP9796120.1 hypothetical protein [Cyanobium sp. Lug-B]
MDLESYFGDYRLNNTERLVELMRVLNDKVAPYFNPSKPFFKGSYEFSYYEYLRECKLNDKPAKPEEVLDYISPLFQNLPNWNNPGTMINVIPPVNLVGLASSAYSNMFNPNFVQDTFCGLLIASELEVTKYISDLAGWDWTLTHGIFTIGGLGTNLYPAKIALAKAYPEGSLKGYKDKDFFMVTSSKGHPCHQEIFGWLGLGSENCIPLPCGGDDRLIIREAEHIISSNIESGKIFVGLNINGGSTAEYTVDPIKEVADLRDRVVAKHGLKYVPHLHVDAVLGWAWLFFTSYDFEANPLKLPDASLAKIKNMTRRVSELRYADSFGADFHKTGFCPYISSLFIVKNRNDYFLLGKKSAVSLQEMQFGSYSPFETSLEYSRSASGSISALATLRSLGIEGYQTLIGNLVAMTDLLRSLLAQSNSLLVINQRTEGIATLFIIKPKNYMCLSLDEILKLPKEDIMEIRNYNIKFATFVLLKNKLNEISFTFTASRTFKVPGTSIQIGAIKAYPMSVFLNENTVRILVEEILHVKSLYEASHEVIGLVDNEDAPLDATWR